MTTRSKTIRRHRTGRIVQAVTPQTRIPGDVDTCPARGPDEPRLAIPYPLLADIAAPTAMLSNERIG